MDLSGLQYLLIVIVFLVGYSAIILEHYIKVNKTAVSLLAAVVLWSIYLMTSGHPVSENLATLGHHISEIAQIIFFLLGAMTLVELIDSHRGFQIVTARIKTRSKKKMIVIVSIVTFFLSAVLDNLTTTILMVSLLRKLVPEKEERLLLCCLVVIAANAGGAWTPIGDVTTTMLWINGQISSFSVIKNLVFPSIISLAVPLLWYAWRAKGKLTIEKEKPSEAKGEPGATLIFGLGVAGLIFVPVFKTLTGLPPFMGVVLALSVLWLVTDLIHHPYEDRKHLRVPYILTRVDTSGILFFLGILLCVASLQTAGILQVVANWLEEVVANQALIATLIGFFSAIVDNVPLVAATMGMYPLEIHPIDSSLWQMIAYAAGTGGSMLIIGSSSGVALMGLEKVDFVTYVKKATVPATIGFLAGMGAYLFQRALFF